MPEGEGLSEDNIHGWNEIRRDLAVRFLFGISFWMLVPSVPTVLVGIELGFTLANITTPIITGLLLTTLFFRKKLTTRTISIIIVAAMSTIYLAALYSFGFMSSANSWFFPIVLMASILIGDRSGLQLAALLLMGFVGVGYGFTTGRLQLPSDANAYISSEVVWAIQLAAGIVITGFILYVVRKMQSTMLGQIEIIHEKNRQITHLANHDPLTGLATMRLANERFELSLRIAKRREQQLALLFLDLDSFKAVNDTYGHDAGDAVLKEVAIRLQKEIRESDTACRIGGDEFLIILSEVSCKLDVGCMCQRLIDSLIQPVSFGSHNLMVGVSIGVALYPESGDSADELRKCADAAMYDVKRGGKNNFSIAS